MPDRDTPQQEEEPELMNMSQLAAELRVTRQWLHALRVKDPNFPAAQRVAGSTRDLWNLAEVRAYWEARDVRPGERTDLKRPRDGGEPAP
jgi:hypothetical protein